MDMTIIYIFMDRYDMWDIHGLLLMIYSNYV